MPQQSYYDQGLSELAEETPITLQRLESRRRLTKNSSRLVIALVGLPARGKSFVARKLLNYLNWSGSHCKIFNVGRYRREAYAEIKANQNASEREQTGACDANFFDAKNEEASKLRERVAEIALQDMLRWLDEDEDDLSLDPLEMSRHSSDSTSGVKPKLSLNQRPERVAIFDATNSTAKRRQWILEMCTSPHRRPGKPTGVVFVESICDDKELIEENYRYKISASPDFAGMSEAEAMEDLHNRVLKYEEQYETVADDNQSYIKIFNLSTKLLVNHIYGRMAKELVPALMAWNIGTRPIFLCRPGETISGVPTDGEDYVAESHIDRSDPRFLDMSQRNKKKSMRGDVLGPNGASFKQHLLDFCHDEVHAFLARRASVHDNAPTGTSISGLDRSRQDYYSATGAGDTGPSKDPFPMKILASTMPRARETVVWDEYEFNVQQMSNLNPLDKGDYAGLELHEIRELNQEWYKKLERDPYNTRFPGGECYRDLIRRLTSVVIDLEQQVVPTLLVSHVSILQCLMAYFRNTPVEQCMSIEIPMHTVVKYTPVRGGGWSESLHTLCGHELKLMDLEPPKRLTSQVSELTMHDGGSHPNLNTPIWGDHMTTSPKTNPRVMSVSAQF